MSCGLMVLNDFMAGRPGRQFLDGWVDEGRKVDGDV